MNSVTMPAVDLSVLERSDWLRQVEEIAEEQGYYQPLGQRHFAALVEQGRTLVVTFETVQGIRALSDKAEPFGWRLARDKGWSSLVLACNGDTWFRDPAVYAYFDRLVDDGFFEDFDRVVFYGAGPCGYAASAYSVAAPGAVVLAVQPQATLDPRVTEWDDRFADMRRVDFTDRYGYAPDMVDAADRAFVLYDPAEQLDAMHAALFTRVNVTKLRLPHMGDALQTALAETGMLVPLVAAAAEDTLTPASFARLYRARRSYPPYLRALLARLDADGRAGLVEMLCRNVTARMDAPRFARRLKQLAAV